MFLPRGVSVSGPMLLPGWVSDLMLLPGGLCPRGSLSRWDLCLGGNPPDRDPPYSEQRAVRILLECCLILTFILRQRDCFQIGYQATVCTGQEQEVYFLHNKPVRVTIFVGGTSDLFKHYV